ncbi:hypothetical protein WCX18_06310 [Sulfurimonas sp. HSL1-2]|uniref:hypothetical protein n=1 Tax=Thiomicrolovo zhangzhouensis TaxID=3131933 RepID=UPI0031F85A21
MIVYGTQIDSDIAFPLTLPVSGEVKYAVRLASDVPAELKQSITCGFPIYDAHGRNVYFYSDRLFDRPEKGQPWCYEVKDVVAFYWVGGERELYYELHEHGNAALLAFWFIHLVLPLYFTLEEMYDFFHAGAVEIDNRPVLFIAPSMGGKSTLTDYFLQQGHPLISDDKVPTFVDSEAFIAVGSHPYHRPYRKFEELGYRVDDFMTEFKPISAFYLLEKSDAGAAIVIEEMTGFHKFEALMPNYLFLFSFLKTKRLKYLSSLLNKVRVYTIQVPHNLNRLSEVHRAICTHHRRVQ